MGKADVGSPKTRRDGPEQEGEPENQLARAKAAAARRRHQRQRERTARVAERRRAEQEHHRASRGQQETALTALIPPLRQGRKSKSTRARAPAPPQTITKRYGRSGVLGVTADETEAEKRGSEQSDYWYGACSAALLALGAAVGHAVLGAAAQDLVKAARDVVIGQA